MPPISVASPQKPHPRGYCGIGILGCKTSVNLGTLWRSAHNFGASFIFVIGARYTRQPSDTTHAMQHLPLYEWQTFADFQQARPKDCRLIAIDQAADARPLTTFVHPHKAIYLLGAEDGGIPPSVLISCQLTLAIATPMCLNVAVAGSIVLYDRAAKQQLLARSS